MRFQDHVVIVTGAARGLGRRYAERFAEDGAKVVVADLRDDVDAILFVIDEAYEILADDLRRERYRRALEAAPS